MNPECAAGYRNWRRRIGKSVPFVALVAILSSCGLRTHSPLMAVPGCVDIAGVDFRNTKVPVLSRGIVTLEGGTGFASDAGDGGVSKDWSITLTQDTLLRPAPGAHFRLLRFSSEHLTGSGEWDQVSIYSCRNGRLVELFAERFAHGAEVAIVNDGLLRIAHGAWHEGDPMCCPSNQAVSTYKYDKHGGAYVLIDTAVRKRQNHD